MKNLETLLGVWSIHGHGVEEDFLQPFMEILQSKCFKIKSLEVYHWSSRRNRSVSGAITLIEEYLPSISTVVYNNTIKHGNSDG